MIFLFYFINIIGISYFLLRKRTFDLFALAFFCQLLYSIPGFFGITVYLDNGKIIEDIIIDETYLILVIFSLSIISFCILFDSKTYNSSKQISKNYIGELLLIIGFISFLTILITNNEVFILEKILLMEKVGINLLIMEIAASLSIIIFIIQRKYIKLIFATILILVDLYIGFRFTFILTLIGIILFYLNSLGKVRLIKYYKYLIILFILTILVFISKDFMYGFKFGFSDYSIEQFKNLSFYLDSFFTTEPFIIMTILNEVIKNNFLSEFDNILVFLKLFPFAEVLFGLNFISFNSLFQPILFPNVEYGMANSIFAQIYSLGGIIFIIIFCIFFNSLLFFGNFLIIKTSSFKALFIFLFTILCFYIYRNDFLYLIGLLKNYLFIYLFVYLFDQLIKIILKKKKNYI